MSASEVQPNSPPYIPGMEFPNDPGQKAPFIPSAKPPTLPETTEIKIHAANPNTALSRKLLELYFRTYNYPFTSHHIDSFDQFVTEDLPAILKSNNPILILKELIPRTNTYMYRVEIFVGGENGEQIEIGTPTISLQKTKEVRVLFPNEARLRNLTYASTIYANVLVRITITMADQEPIVTLREYNRMPLFQLPLLLHSRFFIINKD